MGRVILLAFLVVIQNYSLFLSASCRFMHMIFEHYNYVYRSSLQRPHEPCEGMNMKYDYGGLKTIDVC
jgi:hypothetical protein